MKPPTKIDDQGDSLQGLKNVLGLALVIVGALMGAWVFMKIVAIFKDPTGMEVFEQLVPKDITISVGGGEKARKMVLPPVLFHMAAYGLAGLLLLAATGLCGAFIGGGVNLLQGSLARLEMRLSSRLEKLGKKIEEQGKE